MDARIFISYSHKDFSFVTPIVKLLRVNNEQVFQDFDSLPPGKKWREEINQAIGDATLFILFWCNHSKNSTEVETEYLLAYEQEKDILPVLLDKTPLPDKLSEFQWIDFQELGHTKSIFLRVWERVRPITKKIDTFIRELFGKSSEIPASDYFLISSDNKD